MNSCSSSNSSSSSSSSSKDTVSYNIFGLCPS